VIKRTASARSEGAMAIALPPGISVTGFQTDA
jgi:hypothetical protein